MSHSLAKAGLDKLLIRSPRWAGMALADLLPPDNSVRGHRSRRSVTYWVTAVAAGQRHPSAAGPGPATSRLTVTDVLRHHTPSFHFKCGQNVGTSPFRGKAEAPRSQCFQGLSGLRRWR